MQSNGNAEKARSEVTEYYGETLNTQDDLKTNACLCAEEPAAHIKPVLSQIHDEVMSKFYGCGSPIPEGLQGCTVLDLGCGTGRDCYVLSKFVGEQGRVIGVDMTDQQLEVANKHIDYHTKQFGYSKPNVTFKKGIIEDLSSAGIEDNSVDVIVSNCVLNLSPEKEKVFAEIFRVLKPGGELYFSDVFADRRIPQVLQDDPVLRGECLSGAMYIEDFRRLLKTLNCADYRVVEEMPLEVTSGVLADKLGDIGFVSMTVRAFKLPELEDQCEDYGQAVIYKGTIEHAPHGFQLDDHHYIETGKVFPVCRNTALMLTATRFAKHFELVGKGDVHFGLFDCSGSEPTVKHVSGVGSIGGCC